MTHSRTRSLRDLLDRVRMPAFRDAQAKEAFWRDHDAQMFPMRMSFMCMALLLFPAFGLLDWHAAGVEANTMLCVRAVAYAVLLAAAVRFAMPGNTPNTRDMWMNTGIVATIGAELIFVLIAPDDVAHHYEFGLGVIMSLGAIVLVPRFRTTALLFGTTIVFYLATLPWHPGDAVSITVNTTFNLLVAGAVLVGSFERERLARLQAITSNELAEANVELRESRIEAIKARDSAISANRSKNHFLANMSHELRTPLNAILGFSDMIRSEMFGPINEPRYMDYVEHIHASGTLLHTNINDLLDLARLEAGKFGWEDETFDLCALIDSVVATCDIGAREAGIVLLCTGCAPDTMVDADRSRLAQALINLVTNAVKFTDPDGIVEIAATMDLAGTCTISVRDTGCGMSAENVERMRSPFAQAHENSYSKGKGGLGLGLAIVCGIMERVDGRFELESEEDIGTQARLILPASRVRVPDAKAA